MSLILRSLTVVPILVALVQAGAAETGPAPPATLPELVRAAVASHEAVARADSAVRRADADVRLTSSALLPRLDLNGAWTRYGDAQTLEFAPGEEFELRPLTDWSWSADLRQTLFYGLRDWRARDVARLYRDIARLERRTAVADLALEVVAAFYTAVADAQRVEVRRTSMDQVREQLRVARRRFEVGETAAADVARWQAQVAGEQQSLVVAEGSAELSRRRLARLCGAAELGDLRTPGPIPTPPGDLAGLVAAGLEQRLETQTLRHQIEAAGLMVKVEKGAWLPELEAHAQYFQQKAVFPSKDWLSFSLNLKVPVYDGGLTAARAARAREDLVEVELLEREVHKAISDQVESAAISLRAAEAAYQAAVERQEAAREAHRQVERAYRVGEASASDLLITQTELTDAETAYILARWQRELQAISLRHAVGTDPLPDLELSELVQVEP
jgi:outer membrane protein